MLPPEIWSRIFVMACRNLRKLSSTAALSKSIYLYCWHSPAAKAAFFINRYGKRYAISMAFTTKCYALPQFNEILKIMIQNGAKSSCTDKEQRCPLMCLSELDNAVECLKVFFSSNPQISDNHFRRAMMAAGNSGRLDLSKCDFEPLNAEEMPVREDQFVNIAVCIEQLLSMGAVVSPEALFKSTWRLRNSYVEVSARFKYLLENFELDPQVGFPYFPMLISKSSPEIVELLLAKGVPVTAELIKSALSTQIKVEIIQLVLGAVQPGNPLRETYFSYLESTTAFDLDYAANFYSKYFLEYGFWAPQEVIDRAEASGRPELTKLLKSVAKEKLEEYVQEKLSKNSLVTGGYNRINITEMSDLTKWGYTSWWFFNQLSAEVAVARINSDPTILPNTTIRIKRFNNYCCNATQTRGSSAGQAAVVAQEIAEQHPDVVAVFGDFFTGTTLGDGQVYSQKQVRVVTFFYSVSVVMSKTLASSGYGPAIAALLKSWSVERVAILTTSTLKDTCLAIKSALKQSKIDVAVVVERVVSLDLEYVANIVDLAGARYIISCDTGEPLFDMYMTLATKTRRLVGPQYVWIGLGLLSQGAGSPGSAASKYGPNYYKYAEGFVTVYGGTMSTPAMSQMQLGLLKSVNTFQANNGVPKSMRFSYSALTSRFNALASYDCVGLLVKGLDRVVNSRGATGMDDLVSGRLRGLLNYTAFRDTGYQGANADPFVLTEGGDMATPFIFYYADGKSESLVSLPFATTDISQTIITPLPNKTIHFNGGSFIPPRDRPEISETVLELTSNAGLSIITLMALGFLATTILATITYLYPQNAAIRASSPPFLYLLCISAVLAYTSLWFYIGVPTSSRYIAQICLESLALVILLSSMLVKNVRMLVLYSLKVVLKRKWLFKDWFAVLVVTGFVAVEVVLVTWFMVLEAVDVTMTVFMIQETGMEVVEYGTAVSRAGKVVFAVMWVYHAVLVLGLLVLAFLTRNVAAQHNEASLMVTVALSISVGSVIVYSSKDGTDYLDRVIASAGIVWVLATLPVLAQLIPKLLAVQAAKKIGGRSMLEAMLERASRKSSVGSSRNSAGVGKTITPDGVAKTMPSLPRSSSQLPRLHEPTPSEPPPPLLSRRSTKNLLHTPLSPFPTSKRNDRGSISPSSGSTAKRDSSVFSNTFPISYSSKSSYFLRSPWHEGFIAIGKINKNRFVLLLPRRFDDIETPPVAFSIADTVDEGIVVELCEGVHRLTLRWTNVDLWIDFRSSVYAKQVLDLVMANSGTHESTENK
ncbi:hypothetical protein HDU99_000244 [Rhizoclosmatium hyalinum]|nr:hypothetical protein HDU99_000244 [Rhizoclosmatium hyalinum]